MKRQLAQARPAGTSAVSAWTVGVAAPYKIVLINICNVTASHVHVSLFHDADGTTYDESTALLWEYRLESGTTFSYECELSDYRAAGNIAITSSIGSAATFTIYGEVDGERL